MSQTRTLLLIPGIWSGPERRRRDNGAGASEGPHRKRDRHLSALRSVGRQVDRRLLVRNGIVTATPVSAAGAHNHWVAPLRSTVAGIASLARAAGELALFAVATVALIAI
jgi:hypothetical protein